MKTNLKVRFLKKEAPFFITTTLLVMVIMGLVTAAFAGVHYYFMRDPYIWGSVPGISFAIGFAALLIGAINGKRMYREYLVMQVRSCDSTISHIKDCLDFKEKYETLCESLKPTDWDITLGKDGNSYFITLKELNQKMASGSLSKSQTDDALDIMNLYQNMLKKHYYFFDNANDVDLFPMIFLSKSYFDKSLREEEERKGLLKNELAKFS